MSKERVKKYRLRQKELGQLKREMYLTDSELEQLKAKLAELRKSA
jgi:predicted RNase H-like nuclease (RuvC/YqgF family)